MRRVRVHADFIADYAAQLAWLVQLGEESWIRNLISGNTWIVRTLARFPAIGPKLATDGSLVLRLIRYPKGPYVAWYMYDENDRHGDIVLVRMFHDRQEQPEPDLMSWPLPS